MGKSIINILVKEVLAENKRAELKAKLAKVILPLLKEEVRTFRNPSRAVEEFDKALKSACGDWTNVHTNLNQDRIIFDDGESGLNFSVELDIVGLDNYTMVYRLGDVQSRHKLFNLTTEDVKDFITKELKGRKDENTKQADVNKKKTVVKDDLENDKMAENDKPVTQRKAADEINKKADEAVKDGEEAGKKTQTASRGMKDATKFKKQTEAKDKEQIAKGGKVSKAKELPTDDEKEIKKPKMENQA